MREIKFRAWLKEEDAGEWYGPGMVYFGFREGKREAGFYLHDDRADMLKNAPLMQYTGLKDKHGREIWESDLVRREVCSPDDPTRGVYGYEGIVKWERGKFIIECEEDYSFYDHMGYLFTWEELEVVGNVYEGVIA